MSNTYWSGSLGGGKREERSVTFVFRHASWQHCAGINSFVVAPDGAGVLWTASRDSLIKRWNISQEEEQPCLEADFEGHADWVNAITLIDEDILVSCSSDKTLRVWKAKEKNSSSSSSQRSMACLCGHRDYATSLTAAKSRPIVASGGLGGEVFLWDLAALAPINAVGGSGGGSKVEGIHGSVYSIAGDENCNVLAAGTSDGCIWMIDTRSGAVEATLRGHSSNVRALCLSVDATTTLLSGSADHTIRAWDLRQRRSFSTLAVHTDSVWALAPGNEGLESVYSGGRDGCVYRTHVASKSSQLVAQENHPVTALGTMPGCKSLWVATTSSTVKCWKLGSETSEHAFSVCPLPAVRNRMMFDGGASHPPLHRSSSISTSIPGVPPVCQVAVLTNRRHVLTQDAEENVLLWDLSKGTSMQHLGKVSLQEAERQLFDPAHNVWPWFQPDTRLGCLAGVLLYPGCFLAETYRRDLGDASAPVDAKVNMAQHMLGALFEQWAKKQSSLGTSAGTAVAVAERGSGGDQQPMSIDAPTTIAQSEKIPVEAASPFSLESELSPVVMISDGNGMPPWRCAADAFNGSEREGEIVPQWVADCVLRNKVPIGKDLKMAFVLVPAAKSGLPSLLQSKLNAPRVLGIDKVADYVLRKMAELGITNLAEEPLFWSPEKQAVWEEEQQKATAMHASSSTTNNTTKIVSKKGLNEASSSGTFGAIGIRQLRPVAPTTQTQTQTPATSALLITCGGAAVPWDFTLAAVKQWMWKRPEDLRLEYGIRMEAVLKPPAIRPP